MLEALDLSLALPKQAGKTVIRKKRPRLILHRLNAKQREQRGKSSHHGSNPCVRKMSGRQPLHFDCRDETRQGKRRSRTYVALSLRER